MADHPIKARITEAMKDAMRARDKDRLGAIRLILTEFKKIEVDERQDVTDERAITVMDKMVKQRRDSIKQFEAGGRPELAAVEQAEVGVIQEFLPAALSEAEITAIIQAAITQVGAKTMKEMGAVMNIARPQLLGRADMGLVSQLVKKLLS
ncbi:MAG TPA: GatB/YqeY domain-containing protein [Candidatus Acidoferrum sp.]|nr:GatB/YqeY domain-containing protein [Candidatus Acidoferrum sp.]